MMERNVRRERHERSAAERIEVWDPPVRVFHWLLVILVFVAAFTKLGGPESWLRIHEWTGYAIAGLIVFRLVWGVYGSQYSRIASFTYPPRDLIEYLRGLLLLRPAHYIGHNPAGAMMIFALAAVLIALVATGLIMLGGEEQRGPLAGYIGYGPTHAAKEAHEVLVYLLLAMIFAHVTGVIVASLLHRENLVTAMITGRKKLPAGSIVAPPRASRPSSAAAVMLAIVAATSAGLFALSRAAPPPRQFAWNETYRKECGACHWAFHPSLLPAASWRAILAGLPNHFGEDASLDPAALSEFETWLVANASETWDTEAANRFRNVDAQQPLRVTKTPYWMRKHAEIPVAVFQRKRIGSAVNCIACHKDAEAGRFDDHAIAIPEG